MGIREVLIGLRKDPILAEYLNLPQHIQQEGGTRNNFDIIFAGIDLKHDKQLSFEEFRVFLLHSSSSGSSSGSLSDIAITHTHTHTHTDDTSKVGKTEAEAEGKDGEGEGVDGTNGTNGTNGTGAININSNINIINGSKSVDPGHVVLQPQSEMSNGNNNGNYDAYNGGNDSNINVNNNGNINSNINGNGNGNIYSNSNGYGIGNINGNGNALVEASTSDDLAFLVVSGIISSQNRTISYAIREFYGTCFSITFFVQVSLYLFIQV